MKGKHTGLSEEEVLLAFAVEPIHNRKMLEHYLGEYPEYANALVDCSIELMVDATRGDEVALTSEAVVNQRARADHRHRQLSIADFSLDRAG